MKWLISSKGNMDAAAVVKHNFVFFRDVWRKSIIIFALERTLV